MDRRQTGTNAADSAPGTDDGRAGGRAPNHSLGAGGRRVWIWIALSLLVLLAVFMARPQSSREDQRTQNAAPPAAAAPVQGGGAS